jgi:hypothetical protein
MTEQTVTRPTTVADWKGLNARLAEILEEMRRLVAVSAPLDVQLPLWREALAIAVATECSASTVAGIRRGIATCEALAALQSARPAKRRWWR